MKTFFEIKKVWVLAIIASMLIATSCKKNFDIPPVEIPTFTLPDGATLINISELKARHTVLGALDSINDNVYVSGIVTANDESGNIYKSLYIQDTSGGLYIGLDRTSLYNIFKVGQQVFIKCQGLFLGDYGGMTQLGAIYNGEIGRIPDIYIDQHLFRNGLPGTTLEAELLTIPAITDAHLGMLIKLENMSFVEVGQTFSLSTGTTNRTITDGANTMIVRTSNYANFAANIIPGGAGTVYGILSVFNGDLQLYLRDLNDLSGFDFNAAIVLSEPFATVGSLGTFSQYSVTGAQVWTQSTYNDDTFAKMSGFSGSALDNEDWLISPSLNLDNFTNEKLNFFTMMNYGTAGDGSLRLYFSTDYSSGNPTLATWTEITGMTLSSGGWVKTTSGDVDLSAINGTNVHIAFKYLSTTAGAATWEVGGILITGSHN